MSWCHEIEIFKQGLDLEYPAEKSYSITAYGATEEEIDFANVMTIITNDEFDMTGFEFGTITANFDTIMGDESTVVRIELVRMRF